MSDPNDTPITGLSVFTKEDEDHSVGVVEEIEQGTGSLIIRGNLDLRRYSVPRDVVVGVDPTNDKLILDMTRDDFIEYEK